MHGATTKIILQSVPKGENVQEERTNREDEKNKQEETPTWNRYLSRRTEKGEEQMMQECTYVTRIRNHFSKLCAPHRWP